jgi:hypothetical protein
MRHELWITINNAGGAHYHPLGEAAAREHAAFHGFRVALLREVVTCNTCRHYECSTDWEGTTTESCGYHMQFFRRDGDGHEGYAIGWSKDWYCPDWRGKGET